MTEALVQLLDGSRAALFLGFVVLLRVGGLVALAPGVGEQAVPARIKTMIALGLTVLVMPALATDLAPLRSREGIPFWMLSELMIGLFLGLGLRAFVFALQVAGTIAAQATSLSQLLGGMGGEPQPAVGNLLLIAAIALLMKLGFAVHLTAFLIGSYDVLPAGAWPDAGALRMWGVSGIAQSFVLAFMIAAPFVITGLIYNVALGAINRAMPQLMVAFVGAPALTAGGLMLLAIALPGGIVLWHEAIRDFLGNPFVVPP
ncbi:flagellar biosynthesis protein FliR [Thioclava dalianensis]|uniref:Flagellar biosynthesis protein FliR n=1 Tax=Thioclava dalianensis TaxID=1185766 RepID=A0A074THS6_9RHOB|nr:flagellar biosynthetic protein FliR [Thioclava dalianensis]KEP69705.1 flagellar biosynthesis protein FliR [Thioclava dalianensis]SFM93163.1 flagellar biosynthetic protein FliR [Thioclava dalianensis]